jgi:quercetin dioxygenase-like cupin family protein
MLSKRNISICGIVVCLFLFFATLTLTNAADTTSQIVTHVDELIQNWYFLTNLPLTNAADTTSQIVTHVDEILKENPLKAGEKVQLINIAQDDTITIIVGRIIGGAEVKPHFHKTHNETVYVIKGTGQQMVNDKWVDLKPGSLHFYPMTKVHSTKNTGSGELVFILIFTPAMKETDRHFVQ